jgi:hypothetical protein
METRIANIPPFGLRLQPDLKARVDEAAKANGRSLNAEITARLEWSLEAETRGELVSGSNDALQTKVLMLENLLGVLTDAHAKMRADIDALQKKPKAKG